jgi:beta-N-acetylhexosaminidase
MKGRIAGLLLLPLLFFMATNARTLGRSKSQSKRPAGSTKNTRRAAHRLSPAAEKWVEKTLRGMTLEEKVGQLLFPAYHGNLLSSDSLAYVELEREVEKLHVGGFINATVGSPLGVVKSQAYPTAVLDNQLQAKARIPLLIGADFERGTAMRLDEGTSFPTAMALAAAGRPEDAYNMGRITALEARAVGIHWIYAPDADVNNNAANPIINTRSFGEDPARVSEFVTQFIRGVEEHGGLATAKHFPGHGDTSTDSHLDLPVIRASEERLERLELVPFRAAIAAGVSAIMTGHLQIPALEPDADTPATLSPAILTGLLRQRLAFDGLIVTDGMDMAGVTARYAPGEAAVRAVLAGTDCILQMPVPDAAFEALEAAVKSGRIPRQRLDESVRRILRAKARLGLQKSRLVDVNALNSRFATLDFERAAQDISDRGVTLLRDSAHRLPLDAAKPTRAFLLAVYADPEPYPGEDLEREIRWRVDSLVTVRTDTRFVRAQTVKLPPPESYDLAIVALFVRVSDRKGNLDVPADQAALIQQAFAAGKPVVCIGFGSPYLIEKFPQAQTWLATFGISEVAQISAARALFGQIPIGGRLPVSIPALNLKIGDSLRIPANAMTLLPMDSFASQRLQPAFDAVARAVSDKAFPGAVLAVGYQGRLAVRAFGKLTYEAHSRPAEPDTIYDVASLTKVVSTTTLTAQLVEGDFHVPLDLDVPIERYLPEWKSGPQPEWRHAVTARHLLTHTSGLPAFKEYWRASKSKADTLKKIFAESLEYAPGTKELYSDLGVILLGEIIERLTGQRLDALASRQIFVPLGMKNTEYNPPKKLWPRIAPTEFDANLRKRLVVGEVHDENAYAMGGVAGHAGLFSTAADLAAFCQMVLNGGVYAHKRLLRRATLTQFTTPEKLAGGLRTLGWAVPTEGGSSGHFFSPRSFGHPGFTGTSIWIDPERQLFVILLTNRVHPTRENQKIAEVRVAVHDAVMQGLGLASAVVSSR